MLKEIYKKFIKSKYRPSHILTFEDNYLFRPKNFFNNLIKNIDDNFDSLVPLSQIKKNNLWQKDSSEKITPIYKTTIPTSMTQGYIYQEIQGVGTITKSSNFENNGRESTNTKFFEIDSNYALKINDFLIKNFKLNNG